MWQRVAAILMALALLLVVGLGVMPTPVRVDSIRNAQYELAREAILALLLTAWGAMLVYWKIKFHRPVWQSRIGAALLILGLLATVGLSYLPVPSQTAMDSIDPARVDMAMYLRLCKRCELSAFYPDITFSAFALLVVGATMTCWKSGATGRLKSERQPACDSDVVAEQARSCVEHAASLSDEAIPHPSSVASSSSSRRPSRVAAGN